MRDTLHEALAAIDGVARAEVELTDGGPVGVRVRLDAGADERAVADAIQRVLETHGLRSRVAPARRAVGPSSPPPPPQEERPPVDESLGPAGPPRQGRGERPSERGLPPVIRPAEVVPTPAPSAAGLRAVTVEETRVGVSVTVVGPDGRSVVKSGRRSEGGLREAIVAAVGELIDPDAPSPGLRGVEYSHDRAALTVFVESADGYQQVGAAMLAAGFAYAFGQAVWKALTS